MLGFGKPSAPPVAANQPNYNPQAPADYYNMMPKDADVDFAKFALDPKKFEVWSYRTFAGWRKITEAQQITVWGKTIMREGESYVVDVYERMMNEKGANYILGAILPLIAEGAQTSNLKYSDVYWQWKASLISIRVGLLSSYHVKKYFCKKCNLNTTDYPHIKDHVVSIHKVVVKKTEYTEEEQKRLLNGFVEVVNPYELDPNRIGEVQSALCRFVVYTMKAQGGFAMSKITENIGSMSINKNGMMPMMMPQPQQGGIGSFFKKYF